MLSAVRRISYSSTLLGRIGLRMNNNGINTSSTAAAAGDRKLVIFDKDGTLLCMNSMWAPWMIKVSERMEASTGLSLTDEIYKRMGFNVETRTFGSGHVLESTNEACINSLRDLLVEKGLAPEKAHAIAVDSYDKDGSAALSGELKPFGDVPCIFSKLRDNGYLLAVNTSDTRIMTENTLKRMGVSDLVDMIVCGNDEGVTPKPDAYTALKICSSLGVHPKNAVFVGDTITDVMCGKNAECGLVISVLTGGIDKSVLENKADFVVNNIEEATDLILTKN